MKKSLLIALAFVFLASGVAFAARKARTVSNSNTGIESIIAVAGGTSGYVADVNSNGGMSITDAAVAVNYTGADALLYTGAGNLQTIVFKGLLASDYAVIYDSLTATGTVLFDPKLDAANQTVVIDAKGAPFSTGIYVDLKTINDDVTVVYNY